MPRGEAEALTTVAEQFDKDARRIDPAAARLPTTRDKGIAVPKDSNRSQLHLDAQDRARAALACHNELYAANRTSAESDSSGIPPMPGAAK